MIFSRARLSRAAFGREENWQLDANAYRAHEIVWRLFSDSPERKRDFLFRWESAVRHTTPVLYVVSERPPVDVHGLFAELRTKEYDPQLESGERLAFRLRANPVVKRRDENGRQIVHDVVMDAKTRDDGDLNHYDLVQQASVDWLLARSEKAGFVIDPGRVMVERYTRHEFRKTRGGRRVVIATVDFDGMLEVSDPERLRATLFEGLGPSKGFGCGLFMVRRV